MGIFTEFTNEPGAFWGLIVGLVIGVFRMINEFAMPAPSCGEPDTRPGFILKVHYLYFGILLAFITLVVTTFVSLITPRLDRKYVSADFLSKFQKKISTDTLRWFALPGGVDSAKQKEPTTKKSHKPTRKLDLKKIQKSIPIQMHHPKSMKVS